MNTHRLISGTTVHVNPAWLAVGDDVDLYDSADPSLGVFTEYAPQFHHAPRVNLAGSGTVRAIRGCAAIVRVN